MNLEDSLNKHDVLYSFWCLSFKKIHDKIARLKNKREYNVIKARMADVQSIEVSVPFCNLIFDIKLINKGHNVSFYDIIKRKGIYEPEITKFICETINNNFNCIDIGANNGYYTVLMSMIGGPNSAVYSFEPMPDSYKLLAENVKGRDNILAFNMALGSEVGFMKLNFESEADGTASGIKLPSHKNEVVVPVSTLDHELIDKGLISLDKPTLMKIDVEGFELDVVEGGSKLLSALNKCYVIFEYMKYYYFMRKIDYDALFQFFNDMGYEIFLLQNNGPGKKIKGHREIGSLSANLVAIKK